MKSTFSINSSLSRNPDESVIELSSAGQSLPDIRHTGVSAQSNWPVEKLRLLRRM